MLKLGSNLHVVVVGLTMTTCSGGSSSDADMAAPLGANGCRALPAECAGYCTFADAPSYWCAMPELAISVGTCGAYEVVSHQNTRGQTLYFYDPASGMLVGINIVPATVPDCWAPGDFVFPTCDIRRFTIVCQTGPPDLGGRD